MNTLFWLLLPIAGAAVQARLPTLGWAGGLRLELVPLLVAYAALTWRRPGLIVVYAAVAGLAQDALSAGPFGLSVLGFGAGALLNVWLRRWLDRDLPWVQMIAGAIVAAANTLLPAALTGISGGVAARAVGLTLIAAVATPFVFWGADQWRAALEAETR